MWLLADLFHDLPEVGDIDKPKLVFFFDEAHLLFRDASKAFLEQIAQTVRLIRSKGVGVFFVTQSPTDVPDDVLAQLGSRVQHQLRAHTPNDAKALKATVNTYPESAYPDLGEVITSLGIGEAVITVMNERGAPTPVAWTRLRAPESLMAPSDPAAMQATVDASPRRAKYAEAIDRESAREKLAARLEEGARKQGEEDAAAEAAKEKPASKKAPGRRTEKRDEGGLISDVVGSSAFKDFMRTAAREIARGMFKTGRR
jgi:DNA helicase HerA-like ATPase